MKHRTTTVTHPAHDRLLTLKLQGAEHLARVLDSDAPEPTKLKAAMALARLAISAQCHRLPADGGASHSGAQPHEHPQPAAASSANTPSLKDGAGGSAIDPPARSVTPQPAQQTPQANREPDQPKPAASPAPGRNATPHTPRPEIFNAPAKPLATACFERLGMKFS